MTTPQDTPAKGVAALLGATRNSAFAVANVIIGLERHSPGLVDAILICHDGFSERDRAALGRISPKIELVDYHPADLFRRLDIDPETNRHYERFTHMAFSSFEIFDLLERFRTVIWFDFDLLIQDDISPLLSYGPLAMLPGSDSIAKAMGAPVPGIGGTQVCLGSGLMVVHDTLAGRETLTAACYDLARRYADTLFLMDQGVINAAARLRGLEIDEIPIEFGCSPAWVRSARSAIVHAHGRERRFWNNKTVRTAFPEWSENDRIWREAGGTPFAGAVADPDRCPDLAGAFHQHCEGLRMFRDIVQPLSRIVPLRLEGDVASACFRLHAYALPDEALRITLRKMGHERIALTILIDTRGREERLGAAMPLLAGQRLEESADEGTLRTLEGILPGETVLAALTAFFAHFDHFATRSCDADDAPGMMRRQWTRPWAAFRAWRARESSARIGRRAT